jgi:hypothetical protein
MGSKNIAMPSPRLLLAAAVACVPFAANAEQQAPLTWQVMNSSWALAVDSGAPMPCRKTEGGWPEALYSSPQLESANAAKFVCGMVILRRRIDRESLYLNSFTGFPVSAWFVTDKTGKIWRAYVPYRVQEREPVWTGDGMAEKYETVLTISGSGKQIRLTQTINGRLVPAPEPVFR